MSPRTHRSARSAAWLLLAGALFAREAAASGTSNADLVCRPRADTLDKYAYLRALSLDLRGRLPEPAEYDALDDQSDVPASVIDGMLRSEAFVSRAVRWHRDLLWTNADAYVPYRFRALTPAPGGALWIRSNVGGAPTTVRRGSHRDRLVSCVDEPVVLGVDGRITTQDFDMVDPDGRPRVVRREGWVLVRPYWAPATEVKVCAFDAEHCGEGLVDCEPRGAVGQGAMPRSMTIEVEKRVAALIRDDRPYSELFTSRRGYVNGPLVHYYRHAFRTSQYAATPNPLGAAPDLPDLAWTDVDTWVEITLPPQHAGILTSLAWLHRFQTNRGRANQFYNAFLCRPFQPPPGGLPAPTPEQIRELDLQKREGCKYCHLILEPATAAWGRWRAGGPGFLDPVNYPRHKPECDACARGGACPAVCTQYLTRALILGQEPYLGLLRPYVFLKPEHVDNPDLGPSWFALERIATGEIPECAARKAMTRLLGRAPSGEQDEAWVEELGAGFVRSGLSYRALVKSIVTSPTYRRVR